MKKKLCKNTNPHILLLDPTDIKITLSNEYNLFLNTHSRVSAFILPQSHQFVDHTLVHGPYFEWHWSRLPEIRSKGKCLCRFARYYQIPLHGLYHFRIPISSIWVCPPVPRSHQECLTWIFTELIGGQQYLSLSFNLHCSYYELE